MFKTSKFLVGAAAFSAVFFTACGGGKGKYPDAPDAAVEMIVKELAAGNGGILWQAMPASYQLDVNSIAQLAGTKVDAELYNQGFGLLGRIAEVADKQKEFILNTELAGAKSAEEIGEVEAAWSSIIGFVQTIADSSIASAEGLKVFDGQTFFDTTISKLVGYAEDIAVVSGQDNPLAFGAVKILESTDSTATLEMTLPEGEVETEEFTKVENRWVPTEMTTDWATNMAEARATLEAINPEEMAQNKPQVLGMIAMIEGVLTQIESAETQEQFDQALQGAMMPIMGLMMMQSGMGGGGQGAPTMPVVPSVP
ncbi:MAG: hypothetical protein ACI9ZV_000072 [Candidatus Azotimanducaceae bacterium]|jgi:hypothetical protein